MERLAQPRAIETQRLPRQTGPRRMWSRPLLALAWAVLLGAGFMVGPLLKSQQGFSQVVGPVRAIEAAPPMTLVEPEVVRRVQQLVRERRWVEARLQGIDCVRTNPSLAQCHKLLGTTYVKLGDDELGAEEYRTFLKLAPNHPDAEKVLQILDGLGRKAE